MHKKYIFIIIAVAILTRLFGIGQLPAGFNQDEASFGYDAYSILATGKDQWGNTPFPSLKSFGDYKLPVYSYLVLPFVALFGLTEFAVRLPNAIAGVFAVFYLYLFVKENFKKDIALFASFLLAVSPWHISLSRGAFEANLASLIITAAAYHFYKGIKDNKHFIYSCVFLVVGLFTYHSIRLVIPVLLVFLYLQNRKKISLRKNIVPITIFLSFAGLAFINYATSGGARLATSSIFNDIGISWESRYMAVLGGEPQLLATFFNNKYIFVINRFFTNYLQYFSPQFLFIKGAGEATYGMIPGIGTFYFVEILFFAAFVYALSNKRLKHKALGFVIFWLLVAPVPAALTSGSGYSANRSALMMPAYQIISALGALYLIKVVSRKIRLSPKKITFAVILALVISFGFFFEKYYFRQQMIGARDMKYGMKETVSYSSKIQDSYNQIIFSKTFSEPHIFVAFYQKLDPILFQQETKNWNFETAGFNWVDQLGQYSLGKYKFTTIEYSLHSRQKKTLIVGRPSEFPHDVEPIYAVNYPDGTPAVYFVESKL